MDHLREWQASGVDEELTRLNVVSLEGNSPAEYLLYSESIPRRNDGRVSSGFLQRYAHIDAGGWWCSGIDVLSGEDDIWGCFKPNRPRNRDRKIIKYEHPPKAATGMFALKVPVSLWQKIAARAQVEIAAEDLTQGGDFGFWQWLIEHPEVPLCITEGAKKAGALLSAGYSAIALPGINNGYRTPKDETGKRIGKSHLIPQLATLATPGRKIYIVFDRDSKPKTVAAVNGAIRKTGYLLQKAQCQVKVITWNSQLGKGVDDLIIDRGPEFFSESFDNALDLETWKAQSGTELTYPVDLPLQQRYLPELNLPTQTKLVGIKSPKGTGKTQALTKVVAEAIARKQKVLVIGHRVQLVKELCRRFGLNYISQYVSQIKDCPGNANLGYGLCIDSLHSLSQAKFDPEQWSDSLVIIDEVEQVLWHGLNSSTCKDRRVEILKSLKTLMQNVLVTGQVYIADADLSNIALDYLISLSGVDIQPYIVQNTWQGDRDTAWQVYSYQGKSPKKLVSNLETHIQNGGKPFICLSAQKLTSKWSTQTLEAYLAQKFPERKILRIDSESLADPSHNAYGCIDKLDAILWQYDIVLASPSIETGISIELSDHFTTVWAIAQGIQSENAVRQTISRLRQNVPRHLWCANYSFNKIGNGSTSIPALLSSSQRFTQLNIRLLQQSDFSYLDDLDTGFQAESLLCWAKMAVRYNAGAINYRNSILAGLKGEGHQIADASEVKFAELENKAENSLVEAITEISTQNYLAECDAIANSPGLDSRQYQNLRKKLIKSISDRRQLKKYELQQRYHLPITPKLVSLNDEGWYEKIRLHYFLTLGRPYLADRDTQVARKLLEQGNGSLFIPDFNNSQLGASIGTLELLGIPILLQDQRELRNSDRDLQALGKIALQNRAEIKTILNVGLAKNYTPVTVVSRLLAKIGCKIKCVRYESVNKKRVRVYKILTPPDERSQVFTNWRTIDRQLPGNSIFWSAAEASNSAKRPANPAYNHLQLSLDI